MKKENSTRVFNPVHHLHILKAAIIFVNLLALSLYVFLRIILYDLPFVIQEELITVGITVTWSTGIALSISFLLFAADLLLHGFRQQSKLISPGRKVGRVQGNLTSVKPIRIS